MPKEFISLLPAAMLAASTLMTPPVASAPGTVIQSIAPTHSPARGRATPAPSAGADIKAVNPTSNVLGLPLRLGAVSISCLFLKFNAIITRSLGKGVVFTSSYQNVVVDPDGKRLDGITILLGKTKYIGTFEPGINKSTITVDSLGKYTLTVKDSKTVILSGALPFDVYLSWLD